MSSTSSRTRHTSARAITEAIPIAAASPADLYFTSEFRLLDLSTDVLTLVLNFLNIESLTSVRRACKALDTVTFDRFADHYFAHVYCFICTPNALNRLKDILRNSLRLTERIREVTLTDEYLEDMTVYDMQLVRNENESEEWARTHMAFVYLWVDKLRGPGSSLLHRVLVDLQRLPQSIVISLDLSNHYYSSDLFTHSRQATFFSLVTSRTNIRNLAIDDSSFSDLEDVLKHGKAEFMNSMSEVQTLKSFKHDFCKSGEDLFTEILRSAKELRHLTFNITMFWHEEVSTRRGCGLLHVPSATLLAGHYASLTSLNLTHFAVSEHDLTQILTQCQSTISHLILRRVRLTTGDAGWMHVGRILLEASALAFLQLQIIYASDVPYRRKHGYCRFLCSEVEDGIPPGVTLEGRENVVLGMQKLGNLGVSIFEQQG